LGEYDIVIILEAPDDFSIIALGGAAAHLATFAPKPSERLDR